MEFIENLAPSILGLIFYLALLGVVIFILAVLYSFVRHELPNRSGKDMIVFASYASGLGLWLFTFYALFSGYWSTAFLSFVVANIIIMIVSKSE